MKYNLSILILIISFNCYSQIKFEDNAMAFNFLKLESKLSLSKKKSFLKKLISNDYISPYINKYEINNYHILDFNSDGRLDVIYDGRNPSGIETNNIVFFLNNGDSLKPIIKLNGDFVNLNITNNLLRDFQLINFPCCDNHTVVIENFIKSDTNNCFKPYNSDDNHYKNTYGELNEHDFCVSKTNTYWYESGTEFPILLTHNDSMQFKQQANLFFNPNRFEFSKIDISLPSETKCLVLAEKLIEDKYFCFILVKTLKLNTYQYCWTLKNQLK